MRNFILLALLLPSVSFGAAYKCKDASGHITFTDKKCEFDSAPQKVWDSDLGSTQYPPMFSGSTSAEARAADAVRGTDARGGQSRGAAMVDAGASGGYQCSTGTQSWVQDTPCPAQTTERRSSTVRHSDGTWTSIDTDHAAHVDQRVLSHDALCNSLDQASSTYERNKIKSRAGCK